MRVRESKRRRSIRIGIGPNRPLEVIVPAGTSDRSVRKALEQNRVWISQRLRSAHAVANRPSRLGLDRPGVVHLNGGVVPVERGRGRAIARLDGERLLVGGSNTEAAAAIERWYRREAGTRIADRARAHEPAIGVRATAISIRDPRSRWGSCSSRGTLSFSWRLLLAPAGVLDYVVVHELLPPRPTQPLAGVLGCGELALSGTQAGLSVASRARARAPPVRPLHSGGISSQPLSGSRCSKRQQPADRVR